MGRQACDGLTAMEDAEKQKIHRSFEREMAARRWQYRRIIFFACIHDANELARFAIYMLVLGFLARIILTSSI